MSQTPVPQTGSAADRPAVEEREETASSGRVEKAKERTPGSIAAERDFARDAKDLKVPTRSTDPWKRTLDLLCSSIGLLLTLPAWIVLPILIKLEDGGPVFFTQERVGKGGQHFRSLKFRSMTPRGEDDGVCKQAEKEKHRITRVGAFMRRCALDELPQLLNILKGDMSLVGPRALLPEEDEHRGEEPVRLIDLTGYEERHSVRPGLTGLAQVRAPRDLPHREKFRYDLRYVQNRGLWLDLKLILRSVLISLSGRWPDVGREDA